MDQYVTGEIIRKLREDKGMTQLQLSQILNVTDKAVSRWETGRGYPDIAMLEPLSTALGVSVTELLSGEYAANSNRSFNMNRMKFFVCPVCGNVIFASGDAVINCCGIRLYALDVEDDNEGHMINIENIEDEYYITLDHEMTKKHYISFIAGVKDDGCEIKKLYPEGAAEARFKTSRTKYLYCYCNKHGLFRIRV